MTTEFLGDDAPVETPDNDTTEDTTDAPEGEDVEDQEEQPEDADAAAEGEDAEEEPEVDEDGNPVEKAPKAETKPKADAKPKDDGLHEVKVNGKVEKVSIDELKRGYQTGKASQEKFTQASKMQAAATELVNTLRTNPLAILTDPRLGIDFRKLAEDYLVEQLQFEQASPQEKEYITTKRKLAEMEAAQKSQTEAAERARLQAETQKWQEKLTADFDAALAKANFPKTPQVVSRMATLALKALDDGLDLSPDDLVTMVKEEQAASQKEFLASLDPAQLEEYLGKEKAAAFRKAQVAKVKGQAPAKPAQSVKPRQEQGAAPKKRFYTDADLKVATQKAIRGGK